MSAPVEIAAHGSRRVLALGSSIELDARVSWVPPGSTGHQRINAYLVVDGDEAILVDTGVAAHADVILGQLASVIDDSTRLSVFFTRPLEFSCNGNLDAVATRYEISELYLAGISNPLDVFDSARGEPEAITVRPGATIACGSGPPLEVLAPAIRILVTHWLYEPSTKTVFTSDLFTHTTSRESDASPILDDAGEESWSVDEVRAHLLAKMWWLDRFPVPVPAADLQRTIGSLDISNIAPTLGRVLRGRAQVDRHIDLLLEALDAERMPEEVRG